jgi:hypothetical protein
MRRSDLGQMDATSMVQESLTCHLSASGRGGSSLLSGRGSGSGLRYFQGGTGAGGLKAWRWWERNLGVVALSYLVKAWWDEMQGERYEGMKVYARVWIVAGVGEVMEA